MKNNILFPGSMSFPIYCHSRESGNLNNGLAIIITVLVEKNFVSSDRSSWNSLNDFAPCKWSREL